VRRFFRNLRRKRIVVFLSAGVAVVSLIAGATIWRAARVGPEARRAPSIRKRITVSVTEEKRKVYPYSLVAGGARTVQEAKRLMREPAVRDHYAAVDLSHLKQVTLTSDLVGYVSYRYGDKIYWTAKKLRLKAGETVFTDGQHIVRGRCLNCYSAYPMMPIRHNEPSESTMNTPLEVPLIALAFPNLPEVAPTLGPLVLPPAVPPPGASPKPVPVIAAVPPGGVHPGHPIGGGIVPLLPILPIVPVIPPLIHRRHGPTNGTSSTPVNPTPPPVAVVPEPDYRWILLGALLAMPLLQWVRRRRSGARK